MENNTQQVHIDSRYNPQMMENSRKKNEKLRNLIKNINNKVTKIKTMATDKKSRLKEIVGKAGGKIVDVTSDILSAPSRAISNYKANKSKRDLETIIKGREATDRAFKEKGGSYKEEPFNEYYPGMDGSKKMLKGSYDERQSRIDESIDPGDSLGHVPSSRNKDETAATDALYLKRRLKSQLLENKKNK